VIGFIDFVPDAEDVMVWLFFMKLWKHLVLELHSRRNTSSRAGLWLSRERLACFPLCGMGV
jgi:hypothetical protein